ncbi:MAG: UpxY family transcription antiterminator [Chitinophagaceae bacterium]|nr:UpxY family transcription antiterminator [Chitinophagaceae bacterium]
MQKNWYAVYTKPQAEKKVAASLTKKKLDVLVPMVYTKTKTFRKNKFVFEPLFKSIVFVYATQAETQVLKGTSGIINLLYWLGKPAVIDASEISAIKEFTENYRNIRLEPTSVNNEEEVNNYNGSSISIEGKLYAVKNKTVKVKLPSLGYYLTAELEEESIFVREIPAVQNYRFAHS